MPKVLSKDLAIEVGDYYEVGNYKYTVNAKNPMVFSVSKVTAYQNVRDPISHPDGSTLETYRINRYPSTTVIALDGKGDATRSQWFSVLVDPGESVTIGGNTYTNDTPNPQVYSFEFTGVATVRQLSAPSAKQTTIKYTADGELASSSHRAFLMVGAEAMILPSGDLEAEIEIVWVEGETAPQLTAPTSETITGTTIGGTDFTESAISLTKKGASILLLGQAGGGYLLVIR